MFEPHPAKGAPRAELRAYHERMAADDVLWGELSEPISFVRDGAGAWLEYRTCRVCQGWVRYRTAPVFLIEYPEAQLPSALYLGRLEIPPGLTLRALCEAAVELSLVRHLQHRTAAAAELGITRKTLYGYLRRMDRCRLQRPNRGQKS